MSTEESEDALLLLSSVRHRLSGKEIEHLEALVEWDGEEPPDHNLAELKGDADALQEDADAALEEFKDACRDMGVEPDEWRTAKSLKAILDDAQGTLNRLRTEFAEIL